MNDIIFNLRHRPTKNADNGGQDLVGIVVGRGDPKGVAEEARRHHRKEGEQGQSHRRQDARRPGMEDLRFSLWLFFFMVSCITAALHIYFQQIGYMSKPIGVNSKS